MWVLGGGIVGLSSAWKLLATKRGAVQGIIEARNAPAATQAAAGMLAPFSEGHPALSREMDVGEKSLQEFESFLMELKKEAPLTPSLSSQGTLLVAEDREGQRWLRRRQALFKQKRVLHYNLSSKELQKAEPLLSPTLLEGVYLPQEREILVSSLCDALRRALKKRGIPFFSQEVEEVRRGKRWELLFRGGGGVQGEQLLVAPGAWLSKVRWRGVEERPKIVPCQGLLSVVGLKEGAQLNHMVRSKEVYICPKVDGTARLGASADFLGHCGKRSLGAIEKILRESRRLIPSLDEADFFDVRVGLRPMGFKELPTVKKGREKGLYWAVGHGRSGILLLPWTTSQLLDQLSRD